MLRRTSTPYVSDTSKGKSFNFSEWDSLTGYNNNALIQDFVSYSGALYACINSVLAGDVDPKTDTADGSVIGNYWMQVVRGIEGPQGDSGKTYVPSVSSEGTLSWKLNGSTAPKTVNIKGPQGDAGASLEFKWDGTKLLVRQEGTSSWTASPDLKSNVVYAPKVKGGVLTFEPTVAETLNTISIGQIKGKDGKDGKDGKNGKDGKDGLSAYELAKKHGYSGSEASWIDALEKSHRGEVPKNIILRVDTDPALFPDENYCGTHIQWKYDSEDYKEWNNLIQINQLMNIALSGLNLNYLGVAEHDGDQCYHLALDYNEIDYMDAKNNVVLGPKIKTISEVYIPILSGGKVNPNDPATVEDTVLSFDKNASCEKYFYIYDPNNKGWTLTNKLNWVDVTPGGADTAFTLQEGKDSAITPCETVTSDSTIKGSGSTLVIVCVDENTSGVSRSGKVTFTNSEETSTITINQKAI